MFQKFRFRLSAGGLIFACVEVLIYITLIIREAEFPVDTTGQEEHAVFLTVHEMLVFQCMSFLLFLIFWLFCCMSSCAYVCLYDKPGLCPRV